MNAAFSQLDASVFTVVMATGIVSVAADTEALPTLSDVFFVAALVGWGALAVAVGVNTLQAHLPRPRLQSFAFVAATAVLAARFALADVRFVAFAFWVLAIAAWLVLLARRPEARSPSGGSLLIVVATESLAVAAAMLARELNVDLLYAALAWWVLGLAMYPAVIALIARSLVRRPRFTPDLWVTMGALAIATLAETQLLGAGRALHALNGLWPSVRTAGYVTWALASAWIVPLVVVDARHPAAWGYRTSRWSFVFPLGMYAVATKLLGNTVGIAPLSDVAIASLVVAVVAWILTFAGLGRTVLAGG